MATICWLQWDQKGIIISNWLVYTRERGGAKGSNYIIKYLWKCISLLHTHALVKWHVSVFFFYRKNKFLKFLFTLICTFISYIGYLFYFICSTTILKLSGSAKKTEKNCKKLSLNISQIWEVSKRRRRILWNANV